MGVWVMRHHGLRSAVMDTDKPDNAQVVGHLESYGYLSPRSNHKDPEKNEPVKRIRGDSQQKVKMGRLNIYAVDKTGVQGCLSAD